MTEKMPSIERVRQNLKNQQPHMLEKFVAQMRKSKMLPIEKFSLFCPLASVERIRIDLKRQLERGEFVAMSPGEMVEMFLRLLEVKE